VAGTRLLFHVLRIRTRPQISSKLHTALHPKADDKLIQNVREQDMWTNTCARGGVECANGGGGGGGCYAVRFMNDQKPLMSCNLCRLFRSYQKR
jgi:hypothetical protein